MASGDLRKELECSVCLSVYTDPVNLKCGHNFCRVCIDRVLDKQEGAGGFFCPQCRKRFLSRPALHRNITLRNVVVNLLSIHPDQEDIGIRCTYCVDSPVAAVKSCLHCEASLCEKHLRVHSKSPEHVITDPSTSPGNKKCPEHKKILEYYCTEDNVSICVSCCLIGEHKGHQIESLEKACEKKKLELTNVWQKLITKRGETEAKVQNLQGRKRKAQEKNAVETEIVAALIRDLRRQLDDLEKNVLSEIPRHLEQISLSVSDLIQELEIQKDELSRKMRHIEELLSLTDPLTVLQELDAKLCDVEADNGNADKYDKQLHDGGGLDVTQVSRTCQTLLNRVYGVNMGFYIQEPADILLDIETANNNLLISDDRKTATWTTYQNRPQTPRMFQNYSQVLSSRSFSSGRHYWEVDVGESCSWRVGMCYPSIDRGGGVGQSRIGDNNKSWCLCRHYKQFSVVHNLSTIQLPATLSGNRIRVHVDYEAGKISFYILSLPNKPLYCFSTIFTEPLHAALGLWEKGFLKISGGNQ